MPFITGQYAQTGTASSVTPFQTIERKDVGLTLRVKPQITEGGSVRLVIYQEVSRVDSTSNPAGIITNKRSLESSVTDRRRPDRRAGRPHPGCVHRRHGEGAAGRATCRCSGALFRYDNRQRVKTNLMVFLKPTVVRGAHSADALTQDRYDYLLGEQQRMDPPPRLFWNDTTRPELQLPSAPSSAPLIPPLPKPAMIVPLPEPFVPPPETPPAKPPG